MLVSNLLVILRYVKKWFIKGYRMLNIGNK